MTKKDTLKSKSATQKEKGLYIHIPFCKTRCVYCGFYSTTYEAMKDEYVAALLREMESRCTGTFSTLYLGGGTPSQLSIDQLASIVEGIDMMPNAERTIECNPDDITRQYAEGLRRLGFNRVSLGMQSFDKCQLEFLHRRHDAEKAVRAIDLLRDAGFSNISIDLMYGLPRQSVEEWGRDVDMALSLNVQHISCYCLTYEEDTPLYYMRERGEVEEVDDETARQMYYLLIDKLTAVGFEHYEISNFAKSGCRSRHNSGYWNGTPYIGIGAGAHSYDGKSRSWNVCDVKRYIETPTAGVLCSETLNADDIYNELIMTRLRTSDGLLLDDIPSQYVPHFNLNARKFVAEGLITIQGGRCRLSRKALFVSDAIISSLFKA